MTRELALERPKRGLRRQDGDKPGFGGVAPVTNANERLGAGRVRRVVPRDSASSRPFTGRVFLLPFRLSGRNGVGLFIRG